MRDYSYILGRADGVLSYLGEHLSSPVGAETAAVYRGIYRRHVLGTLPNGVSSRQRRSAIRYGAAQSAVGLLQQLKEAIGTQDAERADVLAAELEAALTLVIEHSQGRPRMAKAA